MRIWIARDKIGYITLHEKKPKEKNGGWNDVVAVLGDNYFPEVTFENSPMEVELSLYHPTTKPLTRNYFADHNWEIVIHEPDENGFILWEAKWKRRMEEGSPYYSDLTVTNMMYKDRFCISGKTGEGSVQYLMAYTEEDLENILKVLDIYDYYKKES